MQHVENDIYEILSSLPSECSYIDYKQIPYQKLKRHDFVKDVIAMLNSSECIGKRRFIIFGVTDEKELLGIQPEQQFDDNEFQNWADGIMPRPQIQTGTVKYEGKLFGYVCILETNDFDIYEVKNTVCGNPNLKSLGKIAVMQGQAFVRRGSRNEVMMQPDRESFMAHKRLTVQPLPQTAGIINQYNLLLSVIALIGGWDEGRLGDQKAIEELYDDDFSKFQAELREYNDNNRGLFVLDNGIWKLNDRIGLLHTIANRIYDDQFKKMEELTCSIILSTDPYLDLIKHHNDEVMEQQRETRYIYSDVLRKNIFEFWAFVGNNTKLFSGASNNTFGIAWNKIVETLVEKGSWKVWDTNASVLSSIAETYPYIFLREIEEAIYNKRKGILQFVEDDKAYSLCEAVALLAMYKDTFSKAGMILLELGTHNECFTEKLITIMLPWLPRTEADIDARNGFMKAAFREQPDLAWKIMIQLMPNKRTTSIIPIKPLFYKQAEIPEHIISGDAYEKAIDELILLACENVKGNAGRTVDLVQILNDVREDNREKLIHVIRNGCATFTDAEKYKIWIEIVDFVANQKRFADENWSLKKDQIASIEVLASCYEDAIWLPNERRLFRNDQWELIDDYKDFEGSEKKISEAQDNSAARIYALGEEDLNKFICIIENQETFGRHMANIQVSESYVLRIIDMIDQADSPQKRFAMGFVRNAYFLQNEMLLTYLRNEQPQKSIKVYEFLPITPDSISCSEQLNIECQTEYWKKVDVFRIAFNEVVPIEFVIEKLLEVDRTKEVFGILYTLLDVIKKDVSAELIADCLLKASFDENDKHDNFLIGRLIDYIQKSNLENNVKLKIEWKYLGLIIHEHGFSPKTIFDEMGKEPTEFLRIFSAVHGGESGEPVPQFNADMFSLLNTWKVTPGTREDGTMDGNHLKKWVEEVLALSENNQRRGLVENYIGKILFYTPVESDGFFISRTAASILHSDIKGDIRMGYLREAICSRGFHWVDETGKQEFELEDQYNQKALLAEREGYTRFADTLRMIARDFHEEALHNIEEAKKWQTEDED